MGADLTLLNEDHENAEPTADLLVRTSSLRDCVIEGDIIPTLIDELPTIAMMACFAEGTTVIRDAAELKVKESNRIAIMVENLRAITFAVAALAADGETEIIDADCVDISYPAFYEELEKLTK